MNDEKKSLVGVSKIILGDEKSKYYDPITVYKCFNHYINQNSI